MNKIRGSTKLGLVAAVVLTSSTLIYIVFIRGSESSRNTSENPSANGQESAIVATGQTHSVNLGLGQGTSELAPVYSDIESNDATIQISEETKKNSPSHSLPQGFGLGEATNPEGSTPEGQEQGNLQELPIDLETPTQSVKEVSSPSASPPSKAQDKAIDTMDPREVGVTASDGPEKDYEETVLTVQRTLTAVNPDGEKQLIRLKIPVMYKSRTIRLEGPTKIKAQDVLTKLKTKGEELAKIKSELESTLLEWNQLIKDATPYEVLLPESPTLPQNQSAGRINREDNPSMSAGKAISYEIINKK
jgi:hypothetical protein